MPDTKTLVERLRSGLEGGPRLTDEAADELTRLQGRCKKLEVTAGLCGEGGIAITDGIPSEIYVAIGRGHYEDESLYELARDVAHASLEKANRLQSIVDRHESTMLGLHKRLCTRDNCVLDGGPEHRTAFSRAAAESAKGGGGPYGCKCQTLHHHVTGDGCEICNPDMAAIVAREAAEEDEGADA